MTPLEFSRRYARQIMLPEVGEAGQQTLAASNVLVIGAGGRAELSGSSGHWHIGRD